MISHPKEVAEVVMTAVRTCAAQSALSEDRQDIVRALPPFFEAVRRRPSTN